MEMYKMKSEIYKHSRQSCVPRTFLTIIELSKMIFFYKNVLIIQENNYTF